MSVFHRTRLANRLGIGGVVTLFIVAFTLLGIGTIASAEPAQQAATATATPAAAAATAVPCVNTAQGVQILLGNPQPGDTLLTGVPVNMAGIAFDPASTSGSGITSVTVYLGDRDAGGLSLGTALLGQPNPQAAAGSQFATAGFTLRTPKIPNGSGGRTIFVYARSAITNVEAILQVPIFLNVAPTPVKGQVPTAVLPPPPACTPTPAVPTATPTTVAAPGGARCRCAGDPRSDRRRPCRPWRSQRRLRPRHPPRPRHRRPRQQRRPHPRPHRLQQPRPPHVAAASRPSSGWRS